MSSMIQIVAGVAIVFFLPGYTLVGLLFPRRGELDPEYDGVYRVALGMGLSIVIAILVGFALNAISTEEHGYVSAGPLWISLISVTAVFFVGGWWRGAYPWMGMVHASLYRDPPPRVAGSILMPIHSDERRATRLVMEREHWLTELKRCADRMESCPPARKEYYEQRMKCAKGSIDQINQELEALRKEGAGSAKKKR
ncbi:MAG: DUF1616 domain-containing protein [Methanobacteriota archaeon]|nr:MAG: DUF1616 domain-containing protein [Euryarchaeota archaeon]